MSTYRRAKTPGGSYFFTVNLAELRGNDLLVSHIDHHLEAFRETWRDHRFLMDAVVVLTDHLHCL